MSASESGRHTSAGKQEVKLIIVSAFLILFGIVQLVASVHASLTAQQNTHTEAIMEYLQCNLHGDNTTCTIKQESIPIRIVSIGVATLMNMAIPWVLFLYIIKIENFKKIKEVCCSKKIIRNEYFKKIKKLCCSKKVEEQNV